MPFPFLPFGAPLAALVLITALTIFGLALRAIDRTIVGMRDTMVAGMVSGFRQWSDAREPRPVQVSPGAVGASPGGREIVDLGTRRI